MRAGLDGDAGGIVALVGRCWADYPGCVLDLQGSDRPLLGLASHVGAKNGAFWVAEADGAIVGIAAVHPRGEDAWEIAKLYVHPDRHGFGLADTLMDRAEAHAVAAGARRLVLWTDTRFLRAHRFYERRSFVRDGPVLVSPGTPSWIEFGYAKPVDGVAVLGPAAAASAVRRLAAVLVSCVDGGASVSFLPPLDPVVARDYMDGVARDVAGGQCVLLGGWVGGVLCGTVRVQFAPQPNQAHRADVEKMLVHPDGRRRGLAAQLMRHAETVALEAGRTLLVLDTLQGGAAERLYRRLGWTEVGAIPGYSVDGAGRPEATVVFYKAL